MQIGFLALAATVLIAPAAQALVSVFAGDATATAGALVTVSVSLDPAGEAVAGVQNDLDVDASGITLDLVNGKPNCQVNPDLEKNLGVSLRGAGSMRALLFSLFDNSPIPAGPLYACQFRIAAAALPGDYAISISNVAASGPAGQPLAASGADGRITITELEPVAINLGSATGFAGEAVSVVVSLSANGHAVSSMENEIVFDAAAFNATTTDGVADCHANPDVGASLTAQVVDGGGGLLVAVHSADQVSPLPDGVLYTCSFSILRTAPAGVLTDPEGQPVDGVGYDGSIVVTRNTCAGDCDGNGIVTIDELVTAINIALGTASIDACRAADIDDDGAVVVPEILRAVINAQSSCTP